jgi:hypothetical protein
MRNHFVRFSGRRSAPPRTCQSDSEKITQHLTRGQEYYDGEKWNEAVIE